MIQNLNEDLAFMGELCSKMRVQLFYLQHIKVEESVQQKSQLLKYEMGLLARKINEFSDLVKEEGNLNLPELKEYVAEKPLRTSTDHLVRMRKFDGNDSENEKLDFFH